MVVEIPRFFRLLAAEIRRRKVLRVVATYVIAAWLVVQVADLVFEALQWPEWSILAVIVTAIVGFPLSFLLAWIIDLRPDGLIFDLPFWAGDTDQPRPEKKSDLIFAAVLGLLLIGGGYYTVALFFDKVKTDSETLISNPDIRAGGPEVLTTLLAPQNSIAVLAFDNFSEQADTDYFASGLAEEILNLLAGVRELSVAARTSSFRFRHQDIDIRDIARLLNVRHVLEGSVRRNGDRILVTAQLINGETGFHDWSKTYERSLSDIFAIQQEIAAAVVNETTISLSIDSEQRLQEGPTDNIDAYIYYLQGKERLRNSIDADEMKLAIGFFEDALEIDPVFSRAFAGICQSHLRLYDIGNATRDFEAAEKACGTASELNPGLNSEINLALGKLYRYSGSFEQAEIQLNKAIAIAPTEADAYIELGEIRIKQDNQAGAEISFLRAVDLKRNYWKAHEALASFYYRTERYQEAATSYEILTRLVPDSATGFGGKGAAYWMLGEMDLAREAYDRSLELKPNRQGFTNVGSFYYYAGQFDKAAELQLKALEYAPDDHRVWGRLAESYRFIPGSEAKSVDAYRRAAELAGDILGIDDSDWATTGLLGLYYSHLGRTKDALRLVDSSVNMSQRNAEALYYQALARLETGDENGALDALAEAVATDGQYREFIATDPDLQSLRIYNRFALLLPGAAE